MGRAFAEANYFYLLPALVVYFIGVWFRALRWRYLLHPLGNFASLHLFRLIIIGFMVNDIIPGRLGLIVRAYILGEKKKVSKVAVGATVGIERIFDGLVLVLFLVVILFFVSLPEGADITGWVDVIRWFSVAFFLFCLLGLIFLTFKPDAIRRMGRMLIRRLPSKSELKWGEWLDAAIVGLSIPRQRGRLFAVLVASLLVWICEGSMFYLISLGFDIGLSFYDMLLVMCIATLSWFVLVAPGGAGTFDYFGRETLIILGVPVAAASAVILLIL